MASDEYKWRSLEGHPPAPHGWTQWKGTYVCMDLRCECGELTHLDAEFAYFVRCCKCGRIYEMDCHIRLFPVLGDDIAKVSEEARETYDE